MRGPFRTVVVGETVSLVGDSSFQIVLAWLVLETSGSAATLGGVLVAAGVPRGLLTLLGGALTDRWSPRTVMLVCHLVRGAALTALTVAATYGVLHTWQFLVAAVVLGVADAFFWPASSSIIPTLVADEQIPRANAVTAVSEQVGGLIGPAVGGILLAATSDELALGFDAVTFFVAAGTIFTAPRRGGGAAPSPDGHERQDREGEQQSAPAGSVAGLLAGLLDDLREGLRHAIQDPSVRVVLLLVGASTLTYSGLFAVGLPALARHYPEGSVVLGLMVSAWGFGQLVGAVAAGITGLPERWGILIISMTLIEGTAFAVLGFAPSAVLAVGILAVLGVGVAYSTDVALPTFIQTQTPGPLLGRVSSIVNLPRVALEPLSIAGLALLVQVDLRLAFLVAALPMLLVGLGLSMSPAARQLRSAADAGAGCGRPQIPDGQEP